jgi:hypothetical protein
MNNRPTSVLILTGLAVITGVLSFVGGWWLMLGGSVGSTFGAPTGGTVIILGALMFGTGVASVVVGYGLWMRRRWAWSGAFAVFGASVLVDVISVAFTSASPLDLVVSVGIAVAAMWLLLQPKQRALFMR